MHFINIINSYFIDLLYVTLEFLGKSTSLVVDDYIQTNLNESSFTSLNINLQNIMTQFIQETRPILLISLLINF